MGKHILFALLSGLLVFGMSNAFAEEPQLSDQEILKAWGQAQAEVQEMVPATTKGLQVLSDENLDEINAAGLGLTTGAYTLGLVTNSGCGVLCISKTFPFRGKTVGLCAGAICNLTVNGKSP